MSRLILDSSFNPPTLAHYELLVRTAEAFAERVPWILLHSARNADKPDSQTAHIHSMMLCMEREIRVKHPLQPVSSLVLDNAPRFIDKVSFLASHRQREFHFILGQDTVVRFFNDKYYPPGQSSQVYNEFFGQGARLWVAPRTLDTGNGTLDKSDGTGETGTFTDLLEEVRQLLQNHNPTQVTEWMRHIHEIPGWTTNPTRNLSSTRVRKHAQQGHKELVLKDVFPSVADYISQNGLYSLQENR